MPLEYATMSATVPHGHGRGKRARAPPPLRVTQPTMAKRGRKAKAQRAAPKMQERAVPAEEAAAAEVAAAETPSMPAAAEAPRTSRAASNALIAAFLLFQVAMPLRYYLGGRGYDERFSWRMFSSVRMQRCDVRVRELAQDGGESQVDLDRALQIAWIGMLERYRPQVVEQLLRTRCTSSVREVVFERACRDTDGSQLPRLQVTLDCRSKQFRRKEGDGT
jgi:hypothetical protein